MRVGIHAKFFMDWGGGVDFLRILIRGVKQIQKEEHVELIFLVPNPSNSFQSNIKQAVKSVLFPMLNKPLLAPNLNANNLIQSFSDEGDFEWVYYTDIFWFQTSFGSIKIIQHFLKPWPYLFNYTPK
jgi:hypothetical protein